MGELLVNARWIFRSPTGKVLALVAAALLASMVVFFAPSPNQLRHGTQSDPVINYAHASWTADFGDQATVAKAMPHIYVATVDSVKTVYDLYAGDPDGHPATVYELSITEVLKGDDVTVGSTISLAQYGGLERGSQSITLIEGDSLLEAGRRYMLASGYDGTLGVEILLNTYGHTDLTEQSTEQGRTTVSQMKATVKATR